ncbi:hypothetical protein MYAER_2546 [Microcystis aeruginosa NIES-2549]|uniref:Uncharacterized protein n=1 Tax=Microcystis aeruginosa NIES-2549 TaxID=1641812 RepID=A0A0F6RM35_MICAE|nr:hypothetical protein MYAER_2546 [Microcystis aeruginosa NIES-2549]AOC53287.1 hypothetical protein amyaer_2578 [Microcystis aeruginosa NIES-2481]
MRLSFIVIYTFLSPSLDRIYSSYLNDEVQSFCFGESLVDTKLG